MFSSISTLSVERPKEEPFKSNLRWILNSVQNIFPITTNRNCKQKLLYNYQVHFQVSNFAFLKLALWNRKKLKWQTVWQGYIDPKTFNKLKCLNPSNHIKVALYFLGSWGSNIWRCNWVWHLTNRKWPISLKYITRFLPFDHLRV